LEEKNRLIEKKTQAAMQASQDRNRVSTEVQEIRDQMDIKDRKINVLQRKVIFFTCLCFIHVAPNTVLLANHCIVFIIIY
jgi:hypothetical protein